VVWKPGIPFETRDTQWSVNFRRYSQAISVFGLFVTAGRMTLRFCRRIALVRRGSTNLGTAIGRLLQATLVMLGLLVGASIVLPSFHARDLIQILGIGGISVGSLSGTYSRTSSPPSCCSWPSLSASPTKSNLPVSGHGGAL